MSAETIAAARTLLNNCAMVATRLPPELRPDLHRLAESIGDGAVFAWLAEPTGKLTVGGQVVAEVSSFTTGGYTFTRKPTPPPSATIVGCMPDAEPDMTPLDRHQTAFALRANGVPEAMILEAMADPRAVVAGYDETVIDPAKLEEARRTLRILRAHVAYLDLPF